MAKILLIILIAIILCAKGAPVGDESAISTISDETTSSMTSPEPVSTVPDSEPTTPPMTAAPAPSTKTTKRAKAKANKDEKRQKTKFAGDILFYWGICFFAVIGIGVIFIGVYKLRGDRKIKRMKKENDREEAAESKRDHADRFEPELIDPKTMESERKDALIRHEKQMKDLKTVNETLRKNMETGALTGADELLKKAAAICTDGSTDQTAKQIQDSMIKVDATIKESDLMVMTRSRFPQIKVRRDTQTITAVTTSQGQKKSVALNVNEFTDFTGNFTVFLGQGLGDQENDEEMWRMIWDKQVCVLVWIGNNKKGDKMFFKTFSPIKERGEKRESSAFEITMKNMIQIGQKVLCYVTDLVHQDRFEKREMLIFLVEEWPKWNAVNGVVTIVDLLDKVHDRLFKMTPTLVCETLVHNMMIQCPTGTHQSVTLAVLHLCRQTWLRNHKINVSAAAQYVRKFRYGAWSLSSGELADEIRLVYAVLKKMVEWNAMAKAEEGKRPKKGTSMAKSIASVKIPMKSVKSMMMKKGKLAAVK